MSDRVIIFDIKRANSKIPISEIHQMCGRVGRKHDGKDAYVDIILKSCEYTNFIKDMASKDKLYVKSALQEDIDELAFHVVSEISNGRIKSKNDIIEWHKKTLNYMQGNQINVDKVVNRLKLVNAIIEKGNLIEATPIGYISTKMYFTPLTIFEWQCNFDYIFEKNYEEDIFAIAWALANTSYGRRKTDPREIWYLVEEYKNQVASLKVEYEGTVFSGILWWYLLGGPSVKGLKVDVYNLKEDFPRIMQTLRMIDSESAHWNKKEFWNQLETMIEHRIPSYLVPLCKLNGISKSFALELYNIDIKNLDDIKDHLSEIESLGNLVLFNQVKKLIHESE